MSPREFIAIMDRANLSEREAAAILARIVARIESTPQHEWLRDYIVTLLPQPTDKKSNQS